MDRLLKQEMGIEWIRDRVVYHGDTLEWSSYTDEHYNYHVSPDSDGDGNDDGDGDDGG